MQSFIETPRFDDQISYGSSGGAGFRTSIFEGDSGIEGAVTTWEVARARYSINMGSRDLADMDVVRRQFYACRGCAVGFRFKDWADYTLTDEVIAIGDGSVRVFPIIKSYGEEGDYLYERRIFKPVSGTLVAKIDGVAVSPSDYSVDYTTGIITFVIDETPGVGAEVSITCEFDVPVRFDTDELSVSYDGFELQSFGGVPLIEIKFED